MPEPAPHPDASAPDSHAGAELHHAHLSRIDPRTLYLLAKLRQDVFTLEQKATDPDLDGRDLEAGTTLVWIEAPGPQAEVAGLQREPVAHGRVLHEPDGSMRIGRVAVGAANRRDGFGGRLMRAALDVTRELAPRAVVRIDAQAHLEHWYRAMGFVTVSDVFMEAGMEHVAMELTHPQD